MIRWEKRAEIVGRDISRRESPLQFRLVDKTKTDFIAQNVAKGRIRNGISSEGGLYAFSMNWAQSRAYLLEICARIYHS